MRTDGDGEVEGDGRDVLVLVAKHTTSDNFLILIRFALQDASR